MRRRRLAFVAMLAAPRPRALLAVFIAVVGIACTARAADAEPKGTPIASGWVIYGATITAKGVPPRHLDDSQAAAFLESWLPASMLPPNVQGALPDAPAPPQTLARYTIEISEAIQGQQGTLIVYYVTDGKTTWVGLPPQSLGGGAFASKQSWFYASARTISAFAGKERALPVDTPTTSTPTTTAAAAATKHGSGSSNAWVWFVVAGLVVLLVAGVWIVRSRR